MGRSDRLFRVFIAVFLLIAAYLKSSWILLAFSGFVFFEAIFSWCIVYQIFGRNSCKLK
jgi:hypothetical protein